MIYVRQPTEQESLELRRMTRQEIGRMTMRAQMIPVGSTSLRAGHRTALRSPPQDGAVLDAPLVIGRLARY
jgi:hypothetical protein